jgi:phenylalanyl-tRNA synthetase beta chain
MALSLSNSAHYTGPEALLPFSKESLVFVHNTANQGLDCLRPSLLYGGLETIRHNQNRQHPDLRLFEFGKTYFRSAPANAAENEAENSSSKRPSSKQKTGVETQRLALFMTGAHSPESWQPAAKSTVDFYTLKAHVQNILTRLGVSGYQETVVQEAPFQLAVSYHRGPQELVRFGKVLPAISKKMEVKNPVFYADFNFDNILPALGSGRVQYQELNKFPTVRRDLALVLDQHATFAQIRQLANKTAKQLLKEVNLFDVFEDEQKLGAGKKSYAVSFLFENPAKTLQDKEIDAMMQQLQEVFEQKLKANIRK